MEPAVFDLDHLLGNMELMEASDVLIRPDLAPAARIHGTVRPLPHPAVTGEDVDRLLERLLSPAQRARFAAEGDLDLGYTGPRGRRFRLNLHLQLGRPALAARALPAGSLSLADLHLPQSLARLVEIPAGLVLVTGPTGCGKSTTLAALVHLINQSRAGHIVTLEDPVEFVHEDLLGVVTQREIHTDTPSFARALRNVLRENPDVILIGELRDRESAEAAIQAALTGHLVLASLHTADACQALQRLFALFPERHEAVALDLSMALRGIASMRLLPRQDTGALVPVVEQLTVTPAVAHLIRQERLDSLPDLMRASDDPALVTFNRSLLELYSRGVISFATGLANAPSPEEFRLAVLGLQTGSGDPQLAFDREIGCTDLKSLLAQVVYAGASDLHLSVGRPPIIRVDGKLQRLPGEPLTAADVRWLLFSVLTHPQQRVFELEKELDLSLSTNEGQRFRVNAYYQRGHAAVAIRAIPSVIPTPHQLRLPAALQALTYSPQGLILTVGPTGSGKTTTIASLIDQINRRQACHIITIEDPVEYVHQSVHAVVDQREVYSDTQSFARALKFVLRQDPDVIVVGEMRDLETISSALTAAETGHLVFASLHTNDAAQTLDRIVDVFPPHQQKQIRIQLAGALLGVASQRLLRKADGTGRVAAFEMLVATPGVRALIREGKSHQLPNVISTSHADGMISLDQSLVELNEAGLITREEAMVLLTDRQALDWPSVTRR